MKPRRTVPRFLRESLTKAVAVAAVLIMAGFAVAGPSGLIAWGDNQRQLEQRRAELAQLTRERDEVRNRVDLLDPRELVRDRLNVAHPDEMVMPRR